MPNNRSIFIGNERNGQLTSLPERIQNELLRVAGVLSVQERCNRDRFDCCNVSW